MQRDSVERLRQVLKRDNMGRLCVRGSDGRGDCRRLPSTETHRESLTQKRICPDAGSKPNMRRINGVGDDEANVRISKRAEQVGARRSGVLSIVAFANTHGLVTGSHQWSALPADSEASRSAV